LLYCVRKDFRYLTNLTLYAAQTFTAGSTHSHYEPNRVDRVSQELAILLADVAVPHQAIECIRVG